jgi:hypothetical protein
VLFAHERRLGAEPITLRATLRITLVSESGKLLMDIYRTNVSADAEKELEIGDVLIIRAEKPESLEDLAAKKGGAAKDVVPFSVKSVPAPGPWLMRSKNLRAVVYYPIVPKDDICRRVSREYRSHSL